MLDLTETQLVPTDDDRVHLEKHCRLTADYSAFDSNSRRLRLSEYLPVLANRHRERHRQIFLCEKPDKKFVSSLQLG